MSASPSAKPTILLKHQHRPRDILHTGPWGLGVLRGAPAVGALLMATLLARHAIHRRAGMRMLQAVMVFGAATVAFALSHSLWLSIVALAVVGAADTLSMVIRISGTAGDA
jgi:hypothetical protein